MRFKDIYNTSIINESINDKHIFKAVILAGGPGSGKSFIAKKLFGGTGARLINSDEFFEYLLVKNDISKKIEPEKLDQYKKQMAQRDNAKNLTISKLGMVVNGMLPLIIDDTGKDLKKILSQKLALEGVGYDVSMVFVNTSIDIALERNKQRERTVPETIVIKAWHDVQKNIGAFQNIFKSDFVIVDNNKVLEGENLKKLELDLTRKSMKFLGSKLKNHIGIKTIEMLKMLNGKYLTDLPNYQNIKMDI